MPRVSESCALFLMLSLVACWVGCSSGCSAGGNKVVIVYSALDREFAEPILKRFTQEHGIQVLAKYDDESTKTVGLTNILMQEARRPRCDVFWNNEILNTLRLEEKGLLAAYHSPVGDTYDERHRSPDGTWHGFAARARVLLVNTNLVEELQRPTSIYDLADSRWKGKVGIARPIAGTTATHAACLFAVLGQEKAKEFFRSLKANDIQILGGNKQVAQAVARGQIAFGLTDTDDAMIEIDRASPVVIVYPDAGPSGMGLPYIPNTLAMIKGCPHPEAAKMLIDFLLSPAVEEDLALSPSAQIPLGPSPSTSSRVPRYVHALTSDFPAAAKQWKTAMAFMERDFLAKDAR